MAARNSHKSRVTQRQASHPAVAVLELKNTWTPIEAATWSGIPRRSLYRLLRDGIAPSIPMGEAQVQRWDKARDGKRRRSCFKYVVPRVAFIRWFEGIGGRFADSRPAA
jgi:hypothetical protein